VRAVLPDPARATADAVARVAGVWTTAVVPMRGYPRGRAAAGTAFGGVECRPDVQESLIGALRAVTPLRGQIIVYPR